MRQIAGTLRLHPGAEFSAGSERFVFVNVLRNRHSAHVHAGVRFARDLAREPTSASLVDCAAARGRGEAVCRDTGRFSVRFPARTTSRAGGPFRLDTSKQLD